MIFHMKGYTWKKGKEEETKTQMRVWKLNTEWRSGNQKHMSRKPDTYKLLPWSE